MMIINILVYYFLHRLCWLRVVFKCLIRVSFSSTEEEEEEESAPPQQVVETQAEKEDQKKEEEEGTAEMIIEILCWNWGSLVNT